MWNSCVREHKNFLGLSVYIAECFIIRYLAENFSNMTSSREHSQNLLLDRGPVHSFIWGVRGLSPILLGGTVPWHNFSKKHFDNIGQPLAKGPCPLS